jgi:hypothetical protein
MFFEMGEGREYHGPKKECSLRTLLLDACWDRKTTAAFVSSPQCCRGQSFIPRKIFCYR